MDVIVTKKHMFNGAKILAGEYLMDGEPDVVITIYAPPEVLNTFVNEITMFIKESLQYDFETSKMLL